MYIDAYVTGYNTVVGQTDETPCIGALGTNICGRRNVVACPPMLPLGTMVEINGKTYICEDRTAAKFRDRFDINCDQDKRCPYQVAGWTSIRVLLTRICDRNTRYCNRLSLGEKRGNLVVIQLEIRSVRGIAPTNPGVTQMAIAAEPAWVSSCCPGL